MGHLGAEQMTIKGGLITGAFVWFGFAATSTAVNCAWQRAKPMLTIIDGGHWLGVLLIEGAILGVMRVLRGEYSHGVTAPGNRRRRSGRVI